MLYERATCRLLHVVCDVSMGRVVCYISKLRLVDFLARDEVRGEGAQVDVSIVVVEHF